MPFHCQYSHIGSGNNLNCEDDEICIKTETIGACVKHDMVNQESWYIANNFHGSESSGQSDNVPPGVCIFPHTSTMVSALRTLDGNVRIEASSHCRDKVTQDLYCIGNNRVFKLQVDPTTDQVSKLLHTGKCFSFS